MASKIGDCKLVPAGFFQRLAALMLDTIIQFCLIYFLIPPLLSAFLPDAIRGYAIAVSIFTTVFLYEPMLVSTFGQTVGHKYRCIKVVDAVTSEKISFMRALARFLLKALLGGYSFITMLGSQRQAVHDHATETKVIKC